jgi:hypothetical protein
MISKRSAVVLITATTPWPLSARLAVRLIAHGCVVHALCPRAHGLTKVSGIAKTHRYAGLDSLAALERAVADSRPSLIVPSDDRAVWQLHDLHARRPDWSELIETSIGSSGSFATARSRSGLMDAARTLGVRVPETALIRSEADIRAWFDGHAGAAVVKLDGTWGGHGVQVVAKADEATDVWHRFTTPEPPGTALKRWMIDRDPLAFWPRQSHRAPVVSIQQFIPGRPANAMLAAWRGELLGLASVEVLCAQGPTGASTIVRLMRHEEITRAAEVLVRHLGLSGFHGLDFILDEAAGAPFLIELNPRCTQLGHLVLPGQGDLAGLVSTALGAPGAPQPQPAIDRDVIAFFPQALAWNPDSPYMQRCHHDVPWSEPALVRELLLDPWPERQWLSRLYHRMRGRARNRLPSIANFHRLAAQCGGSSENREEDFNRA